MKQFSKRIKNIISDYIYIAIGTALTAFGISVFMNPAKLAPGGISGIGTLIYHISADYFGHSLDLGLIMLILSIPIYLLGLALFGKEYGLKTLMGTLLLALFTSLFDLLFPNGIIDYSRDSSLWLCTLFTGLTNGIGIGLDDTGDDEQQRPQECEEPRHEADEERPAEIILEAAEHVAQLHGLMVTRLLEEDIRHAVFQRADHEQRADAGNDTGGGRLHQADQQAHGQAHHPEILKNTAAELRSCAGF